MKQTISIKLFGEAYNLHQLDIPKEIKDRLQAIDDEYTNSLLNIDFYKNSKPYNSINDFICNSFNALINKPTSKLEITLGRKRVVNMYINELFYPNTLFSLFNTEISELDAQDLPNGIYLEETEIGLMGLYKLELDYFDINHLKIDLANFRINGIIYGLIYNLSYNSVLLKKVKSDTLVRSQRCFNIK